MSLQQVLRYAAGDVIPVVKARSDWQYRQWQHKELLSQFRLQVNLQSTLPSLNRSIDIITQPDGRDAFVERALMVNSADLSLRQYIPATGGYLIARTAIQRIDLFKNDLSPASVSYYTTPISIGLEIPLFGFNELKWQRKISELQITEAKREYSEEREAVVLEAAQLFFEILSQQLRLNTAHGNLQSLDTLYLLAQRKHEIGKAGLAELLQLEINQKNAQADIGESRFRLKYSQQQLRNLLQIPAQRILRMEQPEGLPDVRIDEATALQYAKNNRSAIIAFQRRIMEAERECERAEKGSGLEVELSAAFGLNKSASQLDQAYRGLLDQERIRLSLYLPILDGGYAKARREMAIARQQAEWSAIQQEELDLEFEIRMKVRELEMARQKIELNQEALKLAQQKYDLRKTQYRYGQVEMNTVNLSYQEKNTAFRKHLVTLNEVWSLYFELRYLTLFDFENQQSIR